MLLALRSKNYSKFYLGLVAIKYRYWYENLKWTEKFFATDVLMRQSGISQSDVRNVIETKLRPNCDQIAISNSSRA